MNELEFLLSLLLLAILGGLFCNGFYLITRHEKVEMIDGSIRIEGKILKWWSLFFSITTGKRRIYFRGLELTRKMEDFEKVIPALKGKMKINEYGNILFPPIILTPEQWELMKAAGLCDLAFEQATHDLACFLYEDVYLFPKWVRMWLSECPVCYASWAGTFIYWFTLEYQTTMFQWSNNDFVSKIIFWPIFLVILACCNRFIYKKLEEPCAAVK